MLIMRTITVENPKAKDFVLRLMKEKKERISASQKNIKISKDRN